MKLFEYQGKELFAKYGIPIPKGILLDTPESEVSLEFPLVLKSQVLSGDRQKKGGVKIVDRKEDLFLSLENIFQQKIDGVAPEKILVEEKIEYAKEWYISLSYDTSSRTPVIAISDKGGTGIEEADVQELIWKQDHWELPPVETLQELAQLTLNVFEKEHALLVEINPLFQLQDGSFVAGDAKVILDDNVVNPSFHPFLDLPGDIAVLASGGGASMINLDALIRYGGNPANYVEYSGNPLASVVEELTMKVLSKPNLKGCWTVGGTANFTDVYETLSGFIQGLRKITPKPTYPIVVRRDGPRRKEAFEMLEQVAKEEGFNIHIFGPEIPMSESARIMVELVYGNSR